MAIITIPDDYLTIQEGLNNAVSGDTVYVKNGTYNEVVSMATNNIILEAESINTIIDNNDTGVGITISASSCTVKNMQVTDCAGGIYTTGDNNTIDFCHIYYSSAAGIQLSYCNNTTVINVDINYTDSEGIYCLYANDSVVSNCEIQHAGSGRPALGITAGTDNLLKDSYFFFCTYGVKTHVSGDLMMSSCTCMHNDNTGLYGNMTGKITVENSVFHTNTSYGISLYNSGGHVFDNINIYNNGDGLLLSNFTNATISNSEVHLNDDGIILSAISNIEILGSTVTNNLGYGMKFTSVSNSSTTNSIIGTNNIGVYLSGSSNNTFANNVISSNTSINVSAESSSNTITFTNDSIASSPVGIKLNNCDDWVINGVTLNNNSTYGLHLLDSNNSSVYNSTISNNDIGIYTSGSSGGFTVHNNIFTNSTTNHAVVDSTGTGTWNIPKTLGTNIINGDYKGGNYWDDYTGMDSDMDDIGDIVYIISGTIGGVDNLPLVYPASSYHITDSPYRQ